MSNLLCGFDFSATGEARAVPDNTPAPADGAKWRWLHFDVEDLHDWAQAHLPPIAGATLCQPETRPRCERFAEGTAINLRGVNLNEGNREEDMVSLRVWVTERLVVTARLRKVMAVDAVRAACEAGQGPTTPGNFLDMVIDGLTDRAELFAADLEEATNALEETSLTAEAVSADEIILRRRAVIMLRRFAAPQRDALIRLAALETSLLSEDERVQLRESANRAMRLAEALDALRDRLAVLQDHVDARAGDLMGRNSYVLSVVAAIFLPLGFATGLFGVNVAGMPGVETPTAFWLLTLAMAVLGVALLAIFRWKRWL